MPTANPAVITPSATAEPKKCANYVNPALWMVSLGALIAGIPVIAATSSITTSVIGITLTTCGFSGMVVLTEAPKCCKPNIFFAPKKPSEETIPLVTEQPTTLHNGV